MTTLPAAAAITAAVLLAGLAVFQLLLAAGAPWGQLAWGGAHRVLPAGLRGASAVTVLIYGALGLALLSRSEVIGHGQPSALATIGTWLAVAVFGWGIVGNAASRSRGERALMLPVSIVLTACALAIALG